MEKLNSQILRRLAEETSSEEESPPAAPLNGGSARWLLSRMGPRGVQSWTGTMNRSTKAVLFLVVRHLLGAQEVGDLAELSFAELLEQKKNLEGGRSSWAENASSAPAALALAADPPREEIAFKGLHKWARGKTFYEDDYGEDKGHVHKQKDEHKVHDILNTSIMALSYLAFGGYLLCIIASALREKRRKIVMAYPTAGAPTSNQFAHVLQHYMAHRPARPFIRFPAVTLHQGGRKRRRRSRQRGAPQREAAEGPPFEILARGDR